MFLVVILKSCIWFEGSLSGSFQKVLTSIVKAYALKVLQRRLTVFKQPFISSAVSMRSSREKIFIKAYSQNYYFQFMPEALIAAFWNFFMLGLAYHSLEIRGSVRL